MNKLPVNLNADTVKDRYRQVLVAAQSAVTNLPCELPTIQKRLTLS